MPLEELELDGAQRARLLRAALAMAEAAIAPRLDGMTDYGERAALAALRAWLAAPSPVTLSGVRAELEAENGSWHTDPYLPRLSAVFDCLRAAVHGDLDHALQTSTRTLAEAARLDPDARRADERRGPLVAQVRARRAAARAHLAAARLIRAGADLPPPAPPGPMLRPGEDVLEALREELPVAECRRTGRLEWLQLRMRDGERAAYLSALRAAVPGRPTAAVDDDRLPGLVERLLNEHAERALRCWLGSLWVPPFPPLRIPDTLDGPVPSVGELVTGFEAFTPEGRELVWAHGVRSATAWRIGGRADEAVRNLTISAGCLRDLERALRLIAAERVTRWHLELAAGRNERRVWADDGS